MAGAARRSRAAHRTGAATPIPSGAQAQEGGVQVTQRLRRRRSRARRGAPERRRQQGGSGLTSSDITRTLLAALPLSLQPLARFLSLTGWRLGEALSLTWAQIDD